MITTKVAAVLGAAALALGLLVGATGALLAGSGSGPARIVYGPGMMGGSYDYGPGPGMMGGSYGYGMGPWMMGSNGDAMYEWMRQYHGWATPQPNRPTR